MATVSEMHAKSTSSQYDIDENFKYNTLVDNRLLL